MKRNFFKMVAKKWREGKFICVGLDPDLEEMPACIKTDREGQTLFLFNKAIIDATKKHAAVYKLNLWFYLQYGIDGLMALEETIDYIRVDCAEDEIAIILDAKIGDVENTSKVAAKFAFTFAKADALTVSPYPGFEDGISPFFNDRNKGIIVLDHTSNRKGAKDLQDKALQTNQGSPRVFEEIARMAVGEWNKKKNCCLVVGATGIEQLKAIRKIAKSMLLLIPGVGAQGGSLQEVLQYGLTKKGGLLINASRSIIYASRGSDFAEAAEAKVASMNMEVGECLLVA